MLHEIVFGFMLLVLAVTILATLMSVDNWKLIFNEDDNQLKKAGGSTALLLFFANQLMSIAKWFVTDHYAFWTGFKELIWAVVPVINITYVWEWWILVSFFISSMVLR